VGRETLTQSVNLSWVWVEVSTMQQMQLKLILVFWTTKTLLIAIKLQRRVSKVLDLAVGSKSEVVGLCTPGAVYFAVKLEWRTGGATEVKR